MTTKLMGGRVQRVEDDRLLHGRGRYVDDVGVQAGVDGSGARMLHAAVLRSPPRPYFASASLPPCWTTPMKKGFFTIPICASGEKL